MKMKLAHFRIFSLVFITGVLLSSCSKDDTATDAIVGTWTAGTSTASIMVGSMTLTQYYIDVMGATAEEAQMYADLFNAFITQSFAGTITVKADNTYTSNMGGSADTGTWSLNPDRTELTITSSTDGPMTFDVLELTASKMRIHAVETTSEDLNADGTLESITIELEVTFTK